MSDCIDKIKKDPSGHLSFIILAAGQSKKMKDYPNRSILKIKQKNIIEHQIDMIHNVYPESEIILVLGNDSEPVYSELRGLPLRFVFVQDDRYQTYQSVIQAVRATTNNDIFLLHNDVIPTTQTFNFPQKNSTIVITNSKRDGIGIVCNKDIVTNMTFGVKNYWQKIVYLNRECVDFIRQIRIDKKMWNKFDWELYNNLIDHFKFNYHVSELVEINTGRDLAIANNNK